ncbi:hypothetical protein M0R45_031649 [Rubus argutus]|uniref:Uncharacterized protein n=1 Tax=Rubus argutus TaxID=59490 RepID=A0AAW1WIT2_RUBAR
MDRSMDRPIFIHASHTDRNGGKLPQFYVIEEQGRKISGNSLQNHDLMRRLNVPNLDEDIWFSSLVAANSCLYVIGARRKISIGGGGSWYTYEPVEGYMVLDLAKKDKEWRWQHDGDFLNFKHHGAMACEDDGSIYTFGGDRNYHVFDSGTAENIPLLPEELGRVPNLLWVSNKKVLGYTDGRGRCLGANLLVCYDLESGGGKWETTCGPRACCFSIATCFRLGLGIPMILVGLGRPTYTFLILRSVNGSPNQWMAFPMMGLSSPKFKRSKTILPYTLNRTCS